MPKTDQERTLRDSGTQIFEECRRELETALGGVRDAQAKLKADGLNDQERGELNTKLDDAIDRAAKLSARAEKLGEVAGAAGNLEALSEDPDYQRPMGGDDPEIVKAANPDRLRGRRDEDATPDGGWTPGDPRHQALLRGRARVLLNSLIRGGAGGRGRGQRFEQLAKKDQDFLSRERPELLMSPYVDRDGGMITAEEFRNEVIGRLRNKVNIRSRARVISTNAATVAFPTAKIDLPLLKTRAGRGTGEPPKSLRDIFGKIQFVPSGRGEIVKVPEELLADATFDIVGFLATEVAENDSEQEEQLFLTGSGSGEPLGILTHISGLIAEGYTGLAAPVSAAATVTPEDVRLFPLTLPMKYREDGSWLYNRSFLRKVAVLRTEDGGAGTGEFMFQRSLALGLPNTLDGYPAIESEFYPDNVTAGSQGDPLATFGALRHYWIVDRASLTVRLLGELYAETDEVGYKFHKRFDAAPVRAGAFRNMTRGA